jgi:hypothetical protein
VKPDGTYDVIADLSAFLATHPVANPPADFDRDGTWYSLETAHGNLYALNPNQGDLDRITPQGQISRVLDTSAVYGHIVPTALAYHGNFYIGNLGIFPPTVHCDSIRNGRCISCWLPGTNSRRRYTPRSNARQKLCSSMRLIPESSNYDSNQDKT